MPLMIIGDRVPTRWAETKNLTSCLAVDPRDLAPDSLKVALVNNMPDPALEDTEIQFFELLDAASGDFPVCVKLYSLPEVIRSGRAQIHVDSHYFPIQDLFNSNVDGVIITGTEPRQRNLRDEPYWHTLTKVFDWAETNTTSAILSCLAAHASVLYSDNIERNPLSDKQFGVFEYKTLTAHPLTAGIASALRFPHSRWNEVREYALTSHGYIVLDKSVDAGTNLFVKQKKQSLFVHFQGHPEYFSHTLLKEYRRDIRRYLARERETYPGEPRGYFDAEATRLLTDFRQTAERSRSEQLIDLFPENTMSDAIENTWHPPAVAIYRNWLRLLAARGSSKSLFSSTPQTVDR